MNEVERETLIDRPQAEVFAYLADIALWPEWTDHFLTDWHLTREDSYGQGAGARFHVKRRLDRFAQADSTGTRRFGGTGIGLALVKETVDLHAGRIGVTTVVPLSGPEPPTALLTRRPRAS